MKDISFKEKLVCFHCGDQCRDTTINTEGKYFCCYGCKTVFELLNENNLCEYYNYETHPGIKIKSRSDAFSVLDVEEVRNKIISFSNGKETHVTFYLPAMHCSSCIWLLENLQRIDPNIINSRVDFLKKQVTVIFSESKISLGNVALLLSSIGYEPHLNFNDLTGNHEKRINRSHLYKIGISGFCFGNIMMMSFPYYFAFGNLREHDLKLFFIVLNVLLSLPVIFYCASGFFISALNGLKQKFLNIDVPIALAIAVTFLRSLYEIISGTGMGYLDSMSGIVFFMLLGRYFQNKTYDTLTFDRNYKSYFPIAVSVLKNGMEKKEPLSRINAGDRIVIHNNELIPADAILFKGKAFIDYSFVTGEALPVDKGIGEIIYAGGKHVGEIIELEVINKPSQGYLSELWNHKSFNKEKKAEQSFIHALAGKFTLVVLLSSVVAGLYWMFIDPAKALNAFTTPLIVACPCALLLSATFTNSAVIRIFGRNKLYLKNADVIEALGKADTIVFDKTGTLTEVSDQQIEFNGAPLSEQEKLIVAGVTVHSIHPFSRMISEFIAVNENLPLDVFREEVGKGIYARVADSEIKLGSAFFTGVDAMADTNDSRVYLVINGRYRGAFVMANRYRNGLTEVISKLNKKFRMAVLSGDHDGERRYMQLLFKNIRHIYFNQKPEDKLKRIEEFKNIGYNVLMVGDGLNDAGALAASNAGIAIADNINNFSPACDAILDGSGLASLDKFLQVAADSRKVILASFGISLIYNIAGLYFALQGMLSPLIAAVLMPLSSISIILFTTGSVTAFASARGLRMRKMGQE